MVREICIYIYKRDIEFLLLGICVLCATIPEAKKSKAAGRGN